MSRILTKDAAKLAYVLPGGEHVPSVTSIIKLLAKPGLLHWAHKKGLQKIPLYEASDKEVSIGKIAHYFIECWHNKEEPKFDGYRPQDIQAGEEIASRLAGLLEQHSGQIVSSELALMDAKDKYGGTIDLLVDTAQAKEFWDLKTSKRLYIDNYIQAAAYSRLLVKHGYIERCPRIVLLTKDGRVFAPDISIDIQKHALQIWDNLLYCYHAYKKLEKELTV